MSRWGRRVVAVGVGVGVEVVAVAPLGTVVRYLFLLTYLRGTLILVQ